MRIRTKFEPASLMWTVLALIQIVLSSLRLQKELTLSQTGWAVASAISIFCWTLILAFYLSQIALSYWEVNATSIRYRRFWKITELPFSSIVAIRPETTSANRPTKNFEIEIARLGLSIYPHTYLIANPTNHEAFIQALQTNAPQLLSSS